MNSSNIYVHSVIDVPQIPISMMMIPDSWFRTCLCSLLSLYALHSVSRFVWHTYCPTVLATRISYTCAVSSEDRASPFAQL